MRHRVPHLLFASFVFAGVAASGSGPPTDPDKTGQVVLGIRSKLAPGAGIDSMHVLLKAAGEVVADKEYSAQAGDLEFPTELRAEGLAEGDEVEATIEGVVGGMTAVTRLASTEAVAGKELLLEVELEAACLLAPGSPAPTCEAP